MYLYHSDHFLSKVHIQFKQMSNLAPYSFVSTLDLMPCSPVPNAFRCKLAAKTQPMDFNFGPQPYITLNRKWGTFAKLEMQYLYQILGMNLWMPDRCVNGRNELSSNFELRGPLLGT